MLLVSVGMGMLVFSSLLLVCYPWLLVLVVYVVLWLKQGYMPRCRIRLGVSMVAVAVGSCTVVLLA